MCEPTLSTIIYTCPFVPAEWIAAHDLKPMRIIPRSFGESLHVGQGICPFTHAFLRECSSNNPTQPMIFTTTCDQMRRASDWICERNSPPCFIMHVPTTWQTLSAQKLYKNELLRLGRFFETLGGTPPTTDYLAEVMIEYDEKRAQLRAARGKLSARVYSEAIAEFNRYGHFNHDSNNTAQITEGVPLALVGSPLLPHLFDLFDLLQEAGGNVVLDATTTGERTLPAAFNRRALREDPLQILASAYFDFIPDAFRRPNSLLYQWLKEKINERGIQGIIVLRYTWCDTWSGEVQRMKEWCRLPVIAVDIGDETSISARTVSRIQSLLEVLA